MLTLMQRKALEKELDIKIRKSLKRWKSLNTMQKNAKEREKQMLSNELKPLIQSLRRLWNKSEAAVQEREVITSREESVKITD